MKRPTVVETLLLRDIRDSGGAATSVNLAVLRYGHASAANEGKIAAMMRRMVERGWLTGNPRDEGCSITDAGRTACKPRAARSGGGTQP